MIEPVTEPTDLDLDFDQWLAGASLPEESVEILQKPALIARYNDWLRRYQRAQSAVEADASERSAAWKDPMPALVAEGEELLAELEASRTTWYVRAVTDDDVKALEQAFPEPEKPTENLFPDQPPRPVHSPTEAQAKAYARSYDAWLARRDRWNADPEHKAAQDAWVKDVEAMLRGRGAETLARCVVRIEQGGRVITTRVTADQASKLAEKIGGPQTQKIMDAIEKCGTKAPEVPVGFLSQSSDSDED